MVNLTIQCIMFSIPALMHLVSIRVLYKAKHRLQMSQRMYLIHLSISEFLTCFIGIIKRIGKIYNYKVFAFQVHIGQAGIASFVYYFIMISLTLDRFLEVYLNIRYPIYCTEERTKIVVAGIWVLSVCFTIFLYTTQLSASSDLNDTILIYFYPIFGIICVLVALFTYTYIARKIYANLFKHRSRIAPIITPSTVSTENKDINRENISLSTTAEDIKTMKRNFYKRSVKGIYFPILLIATFALFIVIPEIVYFYYSYNRIQMSENLRTVLTTSYFIAFTSDVVIYVFGPKAIRETLVKSLPNFRKFSTTDISSTRKRRVTLSSTL